MLEKALEGLNNREQALKMLPIFIYFHSSKCIVLLAESQALSSTSNSIQFRFTLPIFNSFPANML